MPAATRVARAWIERLGVFDRLIHIFIGKAGNERISDHDVEDTHDDQRDDPAITCFLISVSHSATKLL